MKYWLSLGFEPVDQLVDHARSAEVLGYEGVALHDHVVVKVGERTPHPRGYPLEAQELFPDPFVMFGAMAAVTTRLRFLTWVYVVPLRDPFLLAKQMGTLGTLSDRRFVLGTGVGWLKEEFETVGQDWSSRGQRMDEMLDIITDLLSHGYAEYEGRFYSFPRSGMFPVPTERVPIWIGGHSVSAARRAARFDGYIPMDGLVDRTRAEFREIDAIRAELGLEGPFERMVGWTGDRDPAWARKAEEEDGITSVLVHAWPASDSTLSFADKRAAAEKFADTVMASG